MGEGQHLPNINLFGAIADLPVAVQKPFALSMTIYALRCIKMSLVHDLAESLVGDITPLDGVSKEDKYRMESVS